MDAQVTFHRFASERLPLVSALAGLHAQPLRGRL